MLQTFPCGRDVLHCGWTVGVVGAMVVGGWVAAAHAGVARTSIHDYWHLQRGQREFASVAKLDVVGTNGDGICSGVLIAPKIILTAGHCVVSPALGSMESASIEIGGQLYEARRWAIHPKWRGTNLTDGTDLAMIRLDRPVTNVAPSSYALAGDELNQKATTVGFGAGGTGNVGYFTPAGQKRAGDNIIDFIEGPKKRVLLYDFDGPNQTISNPAKDYPLALEYIAAPGDSGGGLFIGSQLVGITSFLLGLEDGEADGTFRDYAGFTRVQKHWRWIRKTQRDLLRNRPGAFGTPGNPLPESAEATFQQTWKGAPIAPLLFMNPPAAVPEPASAALLLAGASCILLHRRSRVPGRPMNL